VKNLRKQALCPIKIFAGYGCQGLIEFFPPFTKEQRPFMAMLFVKFGYRGHQPKVYHIHGLVKKLTVCKHPEKESLSEQKTIKRA
jgi:hypothetical protein